MKNIDVLVLDENKNRLTELKTRLLEKGISAVTLDNSEDHNKLISKNALKIVLITQQYLAKISKEEIKTLFRQADSRSIIVYDVQNNATRRIAFYKLGAYRVLDNTFDPYDIIEFAVNVLKQHNESGEQREIRFSGSLIDFSIADLINSFGRDKVSGVLRVYTPYCSGKIIFNNGDIDDASSGYHLGEEAVLFMLTWMTGNFTMRKCHIKSPKHKVQLSNIGLLLYGERIRTKYNEIIKKLGHPGVSVKLINKGDLVQQLKNPFYKEVADKLTKYTVLQEVLALSQISVLNLISWLHSLQMTNHLELRDDSGIDIESLTETEPYQKSGLVEHLLGAKEVNYLRGHIESRGNQYG